MLNFDSLARRFLDNSNPPTNGNHIHSDDLLLHVNIDNTVTDPQARMTIVTEIRDNIEVVHSPEYGSFLTYMFPVFYNVLRQGTNWFDYKESFFSNTLQTIWDHLDT